MAYLILADYYKSIQDANLQQIITATESVRISAELAAQAEAISYLRQKYDIQEEFTNTNKWDITQPYSAGRRVYIDASAYNGSATYNIGDYCVSGGYVYCCNTNGTTGTFNVAYWDNKGAQYDIFSALYPFPVFNLTKSYKKDEKVYWDGNIYTCLVPTIYLSHETALQYRVEANLPLPNVFPDDSTDGHVQWFNEGAYMVDAGTDIDNPAFWDRYDTRDQQMVLYFVDITLFHLHSRIAPRNIPQLRIDRYNSAIEWLKMCAEGKVTPNLPVIQPKQGGRIRWGGNIKQINSY